MESATIDQLGSKRRRATDEASDPSVKRARVEDGLGKEEYSFSGSPLSVDNSSSAPDHPSAASTTATSTEPSTPTLKNPQREKKFVCDFPECGKSYTRPVRLAEHQRSHTGERPFACGQDGCDKAFLRDSHLKAHIKTAHEDKRDWVCEWPECGQAFATGQRYRRHIERHEKREQCKCTGFPPCEQYFRKQETLQRHVVSVHMQDKPYVCDYIEAGTGEVCGRKYKQSLDLINHRSREHSGNRYWCNLCSPATMDGDDHESPALSRSDAVGFPTHGELQHHMKSIHPPTCSECGYVCNTASQLRAHVDIHHGSIDERRTFLCDYPECNRGFTKKGNLAVHVRTVHEKQKSFKCGEFDLSESTAVLGWDGSGACGRSFVTKASLEGHVRTQHMGLPTIGGRGSKRRGKEQGASEHTSQDGFSPAATGQSTMSRLTGKGYEESRTIPCTIVPCPRRFMRAYDLEVHLESAHGFFGLAALEAAEAALEQQALSGGQFWIGGSEGEDEEDTLLAQKLNQALHAGTQEP